MTVVHARSGDLLELDPGPSRAGLTLSVALVRDDRMEVMRWVLPAGRSVPEHLAYGPVTVQGVEGVAVLRMGAAERTLTPGTLVYLAAGERHSLDAVTDTVLLVTMVLGTPDAPSAGPESPGRQTDGRARAVHGERTGNGVAGK